MSATYTQETRRMALETPLGKDALLLVSFNGHEEMSRLFCYQLDLRSTKDSIKPRDIVGKNVTFWVEYPDETPRYFNGVVNRFVFCGSGDRLSMYRAEVVPWLWFLTRTTDLRIFQEKTVPEIIQQIFQDLGFSDFVLELNNNHPKWEYCVQYRETDFNFVSRLMEHEGIFYFFRHEQGKHTLVLADHKGAYKPARDGQVQLASNMSQPEMTDQVKRWEHQYEYRSGKWAHTDYNFEQPSTSLMSKTNSLVSLDGNSKFEFYDFPGQYEMKAEGDAEVKLRMEEEEVSHDVVQGESVCRSFSPGFKFTLAKHHARSEAGKEYVVASVRHSGSVGSTYVPGGTDADGYYVNTFTCIPSSVVFRPARITPKPVIQGIQTAVVVGPKGEEIYTDKYGRIKVQFHWDREGKKDENSSCWIRCAQTIAGKQWGAMTIPRIGQEVVVTYLEGDPDRPLVTGVVYNAEQMPAYALPDEKSKSYIKTNTTPGGDGFNEIRFEDKKDKEQIFIHAERNMDVRVKNDSMERIIGNRHQIIGAEKDGKKSGDQCERVFQDKHLNIKRHQIEHIEGSMELLIGHGEASDGGNLDVVIEKDRKELIGANRHLHVKMNSNEKVDGVRSMVSGSHQQKVDQIYALEANIIHIKAGMTMVLEAGVQLSLKVGGNFVDLSPAGVAVNGTLVMINSGGMAGSGPGAQPTAPEDAKQAAPKDPTEADNDKTGQKSAPS